MYCINFVSLLLDINECLDDPCDTNATCLNTNGSFICTCDNHFSGNGFNCTRLCENGYQLDERDVTCGKSGCVSNECTAYLMAEA